MTDDDALDREHLRRLVASWGVVADFCFGDLVLLTPTEPRSIVEQVRSFSVHAQVRPTTSQTLYPDDLVGRSVSAEERPLLGDCWSTQQILDGQNYTIGGSSSARTQYIPVRRRTEHGFRCLGVLCRELWLDPRRRPGRLERVYLEVFERIAVMIASGRFPYPPDPDTEADDPPRVGDGVVTVDRDRTVTFASPNAVSALHRLGVLANAEGRSLGSLGVGLGVAETCLSTGVPVTTEVERVGSGRVIVAVQALPLLAADDATTGAVILLRDVSDLRRRDRLLVSKDATIREVHHRVKNNLQTISALLRLQGRRTSSAEAREAIEESARRIRVIALVHETLAGDLGDTADAVPFDEIVRSLVRLVEESLVSPERSVRIRVHGRLGDLAPEVATPLAVVLTELVQNAVEHAFIEAAGPFVSEPGVVEVHLERRATDLRVEVRDNGVGFPAGFTLATSKSLGLSIVRTLLTSELAGVISLRNDNGAVVELIIPSAR